MAAGGTFQVAFSSPSGGDVLGEDEMMLRDHGPDGIEVADRGKSKIIGWLFRVPVLPLHYEQIEMKNALGKLWSSPILHAEGGHFWRLFCFDCVFTVVKARCRKSSLGVTQYVSRLDFTFLWKWDMLLLCVFVLLFWDAFFCFIDLHIHEHIAHSSYPCVLKHVPIRAPLSKLVCNASVCSDYFHNMISSSLLTYPVSRCCCDFIGI